MSTTAPAKETALARLDDKTVLPVPQLRGWADRMVPQLAAALPVALRDNAQRFARCLVTEVQRNPFIQTCTGLSLLGSLIQAAQLGLEVGGPLGQAYLVPFWNSKVGANEAQMQVGYRGLLTLGYRSGQVGNMFAQLVHANDEFDIDLGSTPRVRHRPAITKERGEVIGVYAVLLKTVTDRPDVEWMSKQDIEDHKNKYSKAANKGFSPWQTAWGEMARKTPLRRLAKRTPVSVDLVTAAVLDEHGEEGVAQNLRALAAEALEIDLPPARSDAAEALADKLPEPDGPAKK